MEMDQFYSHALKMAVLKELKGRGVNTNDLVILEDWSYNPIVPYFLVRNNVNNYFIRFRNYEGVTTVHFKPGVLLMEEEKTFKEGELFQSRIMEQVREWTINLNLEEYSKEEYKKMLQDKSVNFNFEEDFFNEEYFTEGEKEEVKDRVRLLQAKINALNLLPEQVVDINKKLDWLVSDKMLSHRKIEWRNQLIGVIFSIIITLSLDRSVGETLFNVAISAFTGLKHILLTP